MDLSNDLISKFVKITNDADKQKTKEGTVYGTAVKYDGGIYVKIDGSDLLTPVDTTADIQDGERVTITIKDHNATVTGNITSPSANEGTVTKKVTEAVDGIEDKVITEVETLVADRVSTKELDAEVARIDELIAGKATIEDLTATNATIENLKVKDAEIENLVATKATIGDLTATNATIGTLNAKVAYIDTLVNGNLTSDNILSFNITSKNTTIEDAFIKDAMIDRITANKIMSGVIDTNNVVIQSTDGSMLLQGNILQMKDESGKVRIQIGKDTGGNFTFVLYDESGKGVLIDEEGIKSSDAIADGLIVDAKVADNANISGAKLDIASLITEVNKDNSTTIKSSKIYLNEQNQSLEVAFNSLKTQVETIKDVTIDGDLSSIVEQVQSNTTQIEVNKEGINTLVAENIIRTEEISDLEGEIQQVNTTLSNKYASLEQNINGFKTTVSDTYTTKNEFNNLTTNYSTTSAMNSAIQQKANEITSSVSKTYATKQSVTDLTTRVSTAESKLTKDSLTTTIGSHYTTSSDVNNAITNKGYATTSQVQQTVDSLSAKFSSSGGYNKLYNTSFLNGTTSWGLNGCTASVVDDTNSPTGKVIKVIAPGNSKGVYQFYTPNKTGYYTVSFYGRADASMNIYFGQESSTTKTVTLTTSWQKFSHTFNRTSTNLNAYIFYPSSAGTFYMHSILVEEGELCGVWTPHPSEIYDGITTINRNGITISQSNYNGYTQMSASGFYVNNGTENVISCTSSGLTVKGTINATAGTFSGNVVTNNILKAYNSVYAGAEIWGGFKKDSNGNYSSAQTFLIHGSTALQIDGNPTRISSVTGEVKIGDETSYDNLRAREIYAQEIIYTNDLRPRDAAQLSLSNVSMRSANAFIDFSSGYGVIRVKDRNHLYLQTSGNTGGDTSAEIRCTRYSDASNYVNIRAYNVCAQNAVFANGVNVSSDRARKRDIELYSTDALHEVCTTPVYTYHLDTDKDEELKRIGIIMQEAPLDAIDLTGKGVDLYQMVTMLWRAVQQQQEIINELKGE